MRFFERDILDLGTANQSESNKSLSRAGAAVEGEFTPANSNRGVSMSVNAVEEEGTSDVGRIACTSRERPSAARRLESMGGERERSGRAERRGREFVLNTGAVAMGGGALGMGLVGKISGSEIYRAGESARGVGLDVLM